VCSIFVVVSVAVSFSSIYFRRASAFAPGFLALDFLALRRLVAMEFSWIAKMPLTR
jgi:hypothetical protein